METKMNLTTTLQDRLSFRLMPLLKKTEPLVLILTLFSLWCFAPKWITMADGTASIIDQGIWLMVLLGMMSFLLFLALSWWVLNRFLMVLALPAIADMVSQFNSLTVWQQLSFYWASFALLLLSALLCLAAVF